MFPAIETVRRRRPDAHASTISSSTMRRCAHAVTDVARSSRSTTLPALVRPGAARRPRRLVRRRRRGDVGAAPHRRRVEQRRRRRDRPRPLLRLHGRPTDGRERRRRAPGSSGRPTSSVPSAHRRHRDLVGLDGVEPHVAWPTYVDCVVEAIERLGVGLVVTLGAVADTTPHTRPPAVVGSTTDAAWRRRSASPGRPTRDRPA